MVARRPDGARVDGCRLGPAWPRPRVPGPSGAALRRLPERGRHHAAPSPVRAGLTWVAVDDAVIMAGDDPERRSPTPSPRPPSTRPAPRCSLEVDAADVGEHLAARAEGDRVVTHLFDCARPGYVGWRWSVTVARASRQKAVTVDEIVLIPGDEAIVAPTWVPYRERIQPGDLSPGRPAAGRPTTTRASCRRTPSATTRSTPTSGPRSGPSPRTSASGGSGPCRPRVATRPPSGGTTATAGPGSPLAQAAPERARPAGSWSGSPARWRRRSASAPTATPTTTAGSCRSTTAAARTPRCALAKRHEPAADARPRLRRRSTRRARAPTSLRSGTGPSAAGRRPLRLGAAPVRARLRRRQYSRPSSPRPQPGEAGPEPPAVPGVLEPAVERQQADEADHPEGDPDLRRCGPRRRRAARRRRRGRCGCRSRAAVGWSSRSSTGPR